MESTFYAVLLHSLGCLDGFGDVIEIFQEKRDLEPALCPDPIRQKNLYLKAGRIRQNRFAFHLNYFIRSQELKPKTVIKLNDTIQDTATGYSITYMSRGN